MCPVMDKWILMNWRRSSPQPYVVLFRHSSQTSSSQLITMGKKEQVNDHDLKQLADGVFSTLAIGNGEKLTKEQFIQGY